MATNPVIVRKVPRVRSESEKELGLRLMLLAGTLVLMAGTYYLLATLNMP